MRRAGKRNEKGPARAESRQLRRRERANREQFFSRTNTTALYTDTLKAAQVPLRLFPPSFSPEKTKKEKEHQIFTSSRTRAEINRARERERERECEIAIEMSAANYYQYVRTDRCGRLRSPPREKRARCCAESEREGEVVNAELFYIERLLSGFCYNSFFFSPPRCLSFFFFLLFLQLPLDALRRIDI